MPSQKTNPPSISELILEGDKLIGDFIQAMGEWLEEFNRVTDKMIESLRTDDTDVEEIIGRGKGDPDIHGYPGEEA